jgi:hypothetical protein
MVRRHFGQACAPNPCRLWSADDKNENGRLIHPPDLLFQPVEVYANGQKIADLQVGKLADFEASIPATIPNAAGKIEIEFRIPKATSPKATRRELVSACSRHFCRSDPSSEINTDPPI